MELTENKDKSRSFVKFSFRYRLNKVISRFLPSCCIVKKRYCIATFICSGLLLAHAMRTTLAVTAVIILGSNNDKTVSHGVDNVFDMKL